MLDELESISDAVGRSFARLIHCKIEDQPSLTFPLLLVLLEGIGEYLMALDVRSAKARLRSLLDEDDLKDFDTSGKMVSEKLKAIVVPEYTALSYWSQQDGRRHTIAHRRHLRNESEERDCLAFAAAFYDLTLEGPPQLFSVVHYVAEQALLKRPLNVCYAPELPAESAIKWWHIPPDLIREIMDRLLIEADVENKISNYGLRSLSDIKSVLASLLQNNIDREPTPWDFSRPIIRGIESRIRDFPAPLRQRIEQHRIGLNEHLHAAHGSSGPISFQQTVFMLMTHALYRKACPANYLYMFPVRVPGTCSVMHVGTNTPISITAHVALSSLARSVFYQPLLLEYAAREALSHLETEETKARLEVALTAGHNFGGPLSNAETALDTLSLKLNDDELKRVGPQIDDIKQAIRDMTDVKYRLGKLVPYSLKNPTQFNIEDALEPIAFEASDKGFEWRLCNEFGIGKARARIRGDRPALTDVFRELLKNSDRWVKKPDRVINVLISEVLPTAIPSELDRDGTYLSLLFGDNGQGIPAELRSEVFQAYVTRHAKGMGLGLSDARRKVEAHGGCIQAIEPITPGACFEIILPLANDQNEYTVRCNETKNTHC